MENKALAANMVNNQGFDHSEDEIDLLELLGVLIESKWLITIIASVFFLGGVFYAFIAAPIYQADAILQVEKKSNGMPVGLESLGSAMGVVASAATEIEIVKSRNIIGKAVDKLNLSIDAEPNYFPVIGEAMARHGINIDIITGVNASGYAWGGERFQIEQLELPTHLDSVTLISQEDQKYILTDESDTLLLTGSVGETAQSNDVTVFISELTARIGTKFNLSKVSRIQAIDSLKDEIKVNEKGKATGILSVSLEGKNPVLISRIVDAVANSYLRQNIERLSEEAESGLKFLQKQLPLIKDRMESAEVSLNNYRSSKGSVNLTLEAQSLLSRVVAIEVQLAKLDIKRSNLLKKYTDAHPIMLTLANQENKLKEQLEKISIKTNNLPERQQETLRLSRDVKVETTIFTQLLSKVQELKVAKAGTIGNVRIIDTALTAEQPIKPNRILIVLLSLIVGLFLGIAVTFIRRSMNRGIESSALIEKNTGISFYANIPLSVKQGLLSKGIASGKDKYAILCEHDPKDQAIEGLRSLRTNLHFVSLEAKNNIVMISGPAPGVGKSFVSTNFAHIVAHGGGKVLLIDADMRKGHINKEYDLERGPGLSELLIESVDKHTAVRNSGFDNVDILTTGSLPPNPSELLMRENFAKILNEFSKEYDLVLIDTPPLLAVTDAAIIGRLCGTTFLLLRYGMHPMAEIYEAIKRLQQNNIKLNGFIFNGVELHKGYSKYGNYHYEYK